MEDNMVNGTPEGEGAEGLETGGETEGLDKEAGNGTEGTDGETGNGTEGTDGETGNGTEGTDMEDGLEGGEFADDGYMGGMDMYPSAGSTEPAVKDPILSSVPFVTITISVALVVGIVLGVLLGKKRIKKGIDIYEG